MGQLKIFGFPPLNLLYLLLPVFLVAATIFSSCSRESRERPYGYIGLGYLSDFAEGETYLASKRFLVRRDSRGISVMSTLCTYDLFPLKLDSSGDFVSEYTTSRYGHTGEVLAGPAVKPLPYYRVVIDQESLDTPKTFLFVSVGDYVDSEWRLQLPPQ